MPDPKPGVADLSDGVPSGSTLPGPPPFAPPSATGRELPEQFGRYRIIHGLGQGGMGSVFLAEDMQLGRKVALKVSDLVGNPDGLKRFEREARALAALDHPSICHIYDYGVLNGIPFLVMAYIAGQSLAQSILLGSMPPRRAAVLVHDLAVAMQEAHAHGILHRDLKPANVMMKPTRSGLIPVIVDFGLVRRDDDDALTSTGRAMGTLPYMPLEQINGDRKAIGPPSDVYALGIILYELLTGRRPFHGSLTQIVTQKLSHSPEPPSALRADLDPHLEELCLKAMAREITDRHATMVELAQALTAYLNAPTEPLPVPKPPPTADAPVDLPEPATETEPLPIPDPAPTETEPLPFPEPPSTETLILPGSQPPAFQGDANSEIGNSPQLKKGRGTKWPPGRLRAALAASFIGLILLGLLIYAVGPREEQETAPPFPNETEPLPAAAARELVSPFTRMKFVLIPAGSFDMGSKKRDHIDETPRHRVRISRPFYMGICEVTQGEYKLVMGANPSWFSKTGGGKDQIPGEDTDRLPVEEVSWFDAVRYCNALSEKEGLTPFYTIEGKGERVYTIHGKGEDTRVTVPDWNGVGYRLPTEAEWEYACLPGSGAEYGFGGNKSRQGSYAWFAANSGREAWNAEKAWNEIGFMKYDEELVSHGCRPHPGGEKLANSWGLHDMLGNVQEWCWDRHGFYHEKGSADIDPKGPESGDPRMVRGGSWRDSATILRSAHRKQYEPTVRDDHVGFRLVRTYHSTDKPSPAPVLAAPPVEPSPTPAPLPHSEPPPQSASSVTSPAAPPSPAATMKEWVSPFTQMKFVLIPAGSFDMRFNTYSPAHRMRISRPFYMGACEVTQGEYQRVMGTNPSRFSKTSTYSDLVQDEDTDHLPIDSVSWFDAVRYCNALSEKEDLTPFYKIEGEGKKMQVTVPDWTGAGYRLPTEAEWEYACRAGSETEYSFGADTTRLGSFAWFADNSGRDSWDAAKFWGKSKDATKYIAEVTSHGCRPRSVGAKQANQWGLHDMYGNVREWCWDWYDNTYDKKDSANIDPKGPESGDYRVLRGGCWYDTTWELGSAYRYSWTPSVGLTTDGFRLARTYH